MKPDTYLIIILAIIAIQFLIALIVSFLDYNYKKSPPKNPSIKKDYVKAKRYLRANIKLGIIKTIVDVVILIIVILTGLLNSLDLSLRLLGYSSVMTGILFFGAIGAVTFLIGIPFSIFKIFYIEKKYGFNKTTSKTFSIDLVKSVAGWVVIGTVGLFVILSFFEKAGVLAWLYCWMAITFIQIFTMFIYPIFILPISNKLKILRDGRLKELIQDYFKKYNIDIQLDNVRIIDISRRTNKSSAFLAGFGKNKRLVLSDTLLKNHTHEEILAIVAHEVGHFEMNHLRKKLILYSLETFLMMFLLSFIIQNGNFFLAFGVENVSVYLGLMLFSIIYYPIAFIFSTLTNFLSRKYEYAADNYSRETTTTEAMASALDKLGSHNLTNPTPHPLNVYLNYSHPPIKDRINKLKGGYR